MKPTLKEPTETRTKLIKIRNTQKPKQNSWKKGDGDGEKGKKLEWKMAKIKN